MSNDPTSQANFLQVPSSHVDFNWHLDFEAKVVAGSVTHHMRIVHDSVNEIVLDTAALEISKVEIDGHATQDYKLGSNHPVMGSALHISLPHIPPVGLQIQVTVHYKTTKDCTALQWLAKEQTQGKQHPYLFSQCQPIYARSLAPIQDTPSIKTTYSATITSVLPALMSAIRVSPPQDGPAHDGKVVGKDIVTYKYNQPVPIPSYLIALAAGNVVYKPFAAIPGKTWTSGVWAEPELIDASYWEFKEDTARFLATEETIVPPYRFGVYDVLVLPPSFPFGGMENACLTFLTPTLLAGDRSLVDVVVHELTHSWFGNGVTHANATHFWLNEGFTTYMERVLQEKLHSPAARGFQYVIGAKGLSDALKGYEGAPKYQRLVIPFEAGEDPDDAYSEVPYEKGANFLLHLERKLGGLDVFLPYIYDYVNTFTGKSITTEVWKKHLYAYFTANGGAEKIAALDSVHWDAWLHGEGTELPVKMEYDTSLAQQAYDLAAKWDQSRSSSKPAHNFKESDVESFNSNQKVVFLQTLQSYPALPVAHVDALASVYHFASATNAEIRLRFYEVALQDASSDAARKYTPAALRWVVGDDGSGVVKGRMKFCRPVFQSTGKVDLELARKTFRAHESAFHPIAAKMIVKDLGL
ncbi:M1 family metallopeptidase [Phanerochaete sordida]|uniref:M1 family metallopeptidase n=1 Tax=Phanerochaete sordida TaxID=48140 RepID=A0A9P3GC96_9APHY|nr:M1 family metallopeptidase [Phanerochaete sordida]